MIRQDTRTMRCVDQQALVAMTSVGLIASSIHRPISNQTAISTRRVYSIRLRVTWL